jgi:ankyrin repeat protein
MGNQFVSIAKISTLVLLAVVLCYASRRVCYSWASPHSPDERLLDAISVQDPDAMAAAFADGASANAAQPGVNHTVLMVASIIGDNNQVRALIARGASIHARDRRGKTALAHAAYYGRLEVMDELISRGANVHERDDIGLTPLAHAALMGQQAAIELLLRHGAELDSADNDGSTPLMLAAEEPLVSAEVITFLLRAGADPRRQDLAGRRAYDYAMEARRESIAALLATEVSTVSAESELATRAPSSDAD